jgi:hypothetical protein
VPTNGARQHDFFEVVACLGQVVNGIAVVDTDDILFDDRAIVEYLSNIMSRGADQLDPVLKRLMAGPGADERGPKPCGEY